MARVRPLRDTTTPVEGESGRGLFCRALGNHGVPLSFNLLRRLGMQHRNVVTISEDPDIDVEEMARIIRVDVAEIERRRYQPLGKKRYAFFGLAISTSAIEKKTRRFSPESLAISPHIRAIWELRDLPFCPESWQLLIDTCVCGVKQGWIRLNGVHRCDDCGRLLSTMRTVDVPEQMHEALLIVAELANPIVGEHAKVSAKLPAELRELDRAHVFDCIMRLRRALIGENQDWFADLGALHAACAAVANWPSGIATLKPAIGVPPTAWRAIVTRYNDLPFSGAAFLTMKERRQAAQRNASAQSEVHGETSETKRVLVGIRPAYELARLTSDTLLAARSREHLGPHELLRGGKSVPAFETGEVVRFANEFRTRLAAATIGFRVGLGRRAVQDIAACGHMTHRGISLNDDEWWFTEADISDFEAQLRSKRQANLEQPMRLTSALLVVHGRPKPWGAIVGAMLAGDLPFTIEDRGRKLFNAVWVEKTAMPIIGKMASTPDGTNLSNHITQRESLEILNAKVACRAVEALESAGKNPITYSLEDVIHLGKQGVSVLEVAMVTGRSLSSTFHLIKREGINAVADGLWNRRQVEQRLSDFPS